jgi:hypothetical protein
MVKAMLVIVCSLALAWTGVVPARVRATGVECVAHAACHFGGKGSCCAAPRAPEPQSPPAAPGAPGFPAHPLVAPPGLATWTLPDPRWSVVLPDFTPGILTPGTPLYARNCAFLL